jgi:hypothetical protein
VIRYSQWRLRRRWKTIKRKAPRRGIEFAVTFKEFKTLFDNLPSNCPCCELPYIKQNGNMYRRPSVDRIDNAKGYHMDNLAIICAGCNQYKGKIECGQPGIVPSNILKAIELWAIMAEEGGHCYE